METLLPIAEQVAALLKSRGETVAVAESSTGGLISASLLAVPGASAYFLGGAVVYTGAARQGLVAITPGNMAGMRPSTEAYARLLADRARERLGATWGLGESGATGPAGNRYGDAAGHCCIAVSGACDQTTTIETGAPDRRENMLTFARTALMTLRTAIEQA